MDIVTVLIIIPSMIAIYASVATVPDVWPANPIGTHIITALVLTICHKLAAAPAKARRGSFGLAIISGITLAAAIIAAMHQSWNQLALITVAIVIWAIVAFMVTSAHLKTSSEKSG